MSSQQQQQNAFGRFIVWLVYVAASFLRWIGLAVTWGQPVSQDQNKDAYQAALDAKRSEFEDMKSQWDENEELKIEKYGAEYLHIAGLGDVTFLKLYLNFGVPVNYQHPQTGETALHIAAGRRARHVVRELVDNHKCDFLLRDNQGRLASELAHLFGRDPEITELLGLKEREQGDAQGITVTVRPAPAPD